MFRSRRLGIDCLKIGEARRGSNRWRPLRVISTPITEYSPNIVARISLRPHLVTADVASASVHPPLLSDVRCSVTGVAVTASQPHAYRWRIGMAHVEVVQATILDEALSC
jgi:hypothetical protein